MESPDSQRPFFSLSRFGAAEERRRQRKKSAPKGKRKYGPKLINRAHNIFCVSFLLARGLKTESRNEKLIENMLTRFRRIREAALPAQQVKERKN